MAIPRIYWPESLASNQLILLPTDMVHHLLTVLRLRDQEAVLVFNGKAEYQATIQMTGKRSAKMQIGAATKTRPESGLNLELVTCLYRSKQFDTAIQKAVELGVHRITPVISHKSDVIQKIADKRQQQLQKIIIAACEQSGRIKPPLLETEIPLTTWLEQTNDKMTIACNFGPSTLNWRLQPPPGKPIALLIGPAGGFTTSEIASLNAAHIPNLNLGPRILRSDTAVTVALALLQQHWGDLGA